MTTILGVKGWDLSEYAISANAILGIRDSGKTYTGTEAAEELFDAGVPFIAFDPIGVWHSLRIPGKGKGYPVVVAGGRHADLPLTRKDAGAIVRAAMSAGVSLVIDLFSMELSKADWRSIVRECVEILLHENADHGLRHVFIEEAAEFCPQRVTDGLVFAAVEKLVRMGGNSKLGCTLINQRSADLNKSVLENCANVFVHRQKGKNTLTDLKKWFTLLELSEDEQAKIADSLPNLKSGECWALINDLPKPVFLKVPAKNSLHPDRRAATVQGEAKRQPVPATAFVEQMRARLTSKAKAPVASAPPSKSVEKINTVDQKTQDRTVAAARAEGYAAGWNDGWPAGWKIGYGKGARDQEAMYIQVTAPTMPDAPPAPKVPKVPQGTLNDVAVPAAPRPAMREIIPLAGKAARSRGSVRDRVLGALAELEAIGVSPAPRIQAAFLAGYKHDGVPNFRNTAGALRSEGLVTYPTSETIELTDAGRRAAPSVEPPATSAQLHQRIISLLDGVEARIIPHLIEAYPRDMDRDELARLAGYAHAGVPNFRNTLGRLRSLGFVMYPNSGSAKAMPTLFLEGR